MMVSDNDFASVPILDWSLLSSPETRPIFLSALRHALISVGFLYLSHPPVSLALVSRVKAYAPRLFSDLSQEQKDALAMTNSPGFLGYTRLGAERTKARADMREQIDFATAYHAGWTPKSTEPDYMRLWGESQWPEEQDLPGFKETFGEYLQQLEALSFEFSDLLAEALGLAPRALDAFYGSRSEVQHRAKIVKYPARDSFDSDQGVGPHFDGGFLTFLLQASQHEGLQVQNAAGAWIDVPPLEDTFVVNIGKALEAATLGLARATSHRVRSPPPGASPRFSVPFFQGISQRVVIGDVRLEFPEEVKKIAEGRTTSGTDSVNYAEYATSMPSGLVNLIGRVKSHPDVAKRHYPELYGTYFPENGEVAETITY